MLGDARRSLIEAPGGARGGGGEPTPRRRRRRRRRRGDDDGGDSGGGGVAEALRAAAGLGDHDGALLSETWQGPDAWQVWVELGLS